MLQARQRRVAGPEIVDRELEAAIVHVLQDRLRPVRVDHGGRFGDLDGEPRRIHACRLEPRHDPRRRRRAASSCRGDRLKLMSNVSPSARHIASWRLSSSTTQSPIASMRPISSASGMNSPGWIEAAARVRPSDQRLHADHAARREVHERLVVQHPALVLDGLPQPGAERQLAHGVRRAGSVHERARRGRSACFGTSRCRRASAASRRLAVRSGTR